MIEKKVLEANWRQYAANFILEAASRDTPKEHIDILLQYAKPLILSGLPIIFDTINLCELVGYSNKYVLGAANRSEHYYRYFQIAKRSGSPRQIAEPLPSLKEIQTWILRRILEQVSIHPAAKAFEKNRSIRENARFHRGQPGVITIDIKDFFGRIKASRVFPVFNRLGYSKQVSSLLTDLCCLNRSLPQGAPTSPKLSNLVCVGLDRRLFAYARHKNTRYTRYADDMTFSGHDLGKNFVDDVYSILNDFGFEPQLAKTRLMRSHQRQQVTGIIVNQKLQAKREFRRARALRMDAYNIERFGIDSHAASNNIERTNFRQHLLGKAGFVKHLNNSDRDSLKLTSLLVED